LYFRRLNKGELNMAIETYKPTGDEPQAPKEYDHVRTKVKLEPGQRIRNVIISDLRTGKNDEGEYLNVMLDDTNEEDYYLFHVSTNQAPNKNVWGKQFMNVFLMTDPETGYYSVKPQFENKPVWFSKDVVVDSQTNTRKRYHNMSWGYEERISNDQSVDTPTAIEIPDDIKASLDLSFGNGLEVYVAGQKIVTEFGKSPAEALAIAKQYYTSRGQ